MSPQRALLASLAISACLLPGWIPGLRGLDAWVMLGWAALLAPFLGALAARQCAGVHALGVLGLCLAQCALVLALSFRMVTEPALGCAVIAGLGMLGYGLGRLFGQLAPALLMLCLGLCLAPSAPGWIGEPLAPEWSARLLDLSPWTWVMESSGIDWLRHAAVYEPAGALDIDPALRQARSGGSLAVMLLIVGGCGALVGEVLARRRGAALVR